MLEELTSPWFCCIEHMSLFAVVSEAAHCGAEQRVVLVTHLPAQAFLHRSQNHVPRERKQRHSLATSLP